MKGLGKILIAVDLGIAALAGAMKLYVEDGVGEVAEPAVSQARATAVVAPPPAVPDTLSPEAIPPDTWLLVGLGATVLLCLAAYVLIGIYERRRAEHPAFDEPLGSLPLPAEPPPLRETSPFRAAAPHGDQPVFGRASAKPRPAGKAPPSSESPLSTASG